MARKREFEGYASTHDLDLGGDRILPGAYEATLRAWRSGRVIPLLDSHDHGGTVRSVLGHVVDLKTDDRGLWAKFHVVDGMDGGELLNRLRAGSLSGLSIGYRIPPGGASEGDDGARELSAVDVREVSACAFPMNEAARVLAVGGEPTAVAEALAALAHDPNAPSEAAMAVYRKLTGLPARPLPAGF
jgi:HK97 family phage prohead protease